MSGKVLDPHAYVAVVGEIETLHQKRLAFIQDHNEPVS